MDRKKILEQQLREARRLGDRDWAQELEQELEDLVQEDHGTEALKRLKSQLKARPADELEEIYDPEAEADGLDPEISAELESPVTVLSAPDSLLTPNPVVLRLAQAAEHLIPGHVIVDPEEGIVFTKDLPLLVYLTTLRGLVFKRTGNRVVKHGLDTIIRGTVGTTIVYFRIDVRGMIDQIIVE